MPETGGSDVARRAVRGVVSTMTSQVGRAGLQFLSLAVLARLLTKDDFGLFAMAMVLVGFGQIMRDLGLYSAAVRSSELTLEQRDSLFWVNTAIGAAATVLVAAAGPLVAHVYGRPELTAITVGLAPTFLLLSISTQHRVMLVRSLRFGALAVTEVVAAVVALAVAVLLAVEGAGYWALVGQQVVGAAVLVVGLVLLDPWVPARPRRGVGVAPTVRLGGAMTVNSVLTYFSLTVDSALVGARFGADVLGAYNRGIQLVRLPLKYLEGPLGVVALPLVGRVQHDPVRLVDRVRLMQLGVGLPVAVAVAVLVAVPEYVVEVALGQGWELAIPLIVWFGIAGLLQTMGDAAGTLLVARGVTAPLAWVSVFNAVLIGVSVWVGSTWGPQGVAASLVAAAVVGIPVSYVICHQFAGVNVLPLAFGALRIAAICAFLTLCARFVDKLWLGDAPALVHVIVAGLVCLVALAAATVNLHVRRDLGMIANLAKVALRRGEAASTDL